MTAQLILWIAFGTIISVVLALDLGVFHRKSEEQSLRNAAQWTIFWVLLALAYNASIYFMEGAQPALEFFTGYLIEWSLSMDNVFVFALIFTCFCVPKAYQHKVLFWGIIGAMVMRLTFILLGSALLEQFHWVLYVFGVIVLLAGIRMFSHKPEEIHPERNPILKLACRYMRVTPQFVGDRFFTRDSGMLMATPLFLVLLVVETTDVVFAVDSVPAIFSITRNPAIVFTSNVFAIMGLRALYFLLAGIMGKFHRLSDGLALVLCFVGVKMLVTDVYHIPTAASLGVIVLILGGAIGLSLLRPEPVKCEAECPADSDEAVLSCDLVEGDK